MRVHRGPIICDLCGSVFLDRDCLVQHRRYKHTADAEKQHQCAKCGRGFVKQCEFEKHLEQHERGLDFQCSHRDTGCRGMFASEKARLRHEKRFHKDKVR